MVIRRSDPRRRRVGVLIDDNNSTQVEMGSEVKSAPVAKSKSAKSSGKQKPTAAYASAANRRHLAKTTDLLPKRILPCVLFATVLVVLLGVLNALYFYATQMTEVLGTHALKVFSLTDQGSLSQWFTTMLLIVSGMASLQIYALRQHRSDDYRGTYRLWLWFSILLLLASVDSAVGLHDLCINAISTLTGTSLSQGGWALITIKLAALTGLIARGIVEVRNSRGAIVAVLFVWFAYAGAILMQLPQAKGGVVLEYEPVYGNLILVGTTALLTAIVTYARFVYLQAQGLLVIKEKQTKEKVKKETKVKTKAAPKSKSKTTSKRKKVKEKVVEEPVEEPIEEVEPESEQKFATAKGPGNKSSKKKSKKRRVETAPSEQTEEGSADEQDDLQSLPLGNRLKKKKLSKSERRSQRKAEKQQRRAA